MSDGRFVGPFDRVLYLKQLEGMGELSYGELAVLARQLRERHYSRGDYLLREGSSIESIFILVEGEVRLEKNGKTDARSLPGQGVGVTHWLAEEKGGVTAVAETDCLALELPAAAFLEILEDHFNLYMALVRSFAGLVYDQLQHTADGTVKRVWDKDVTLPDRPLDLVERIVLMRRSPIMTDVSLETLANIASGMVQGALEPGEKLWSAGDVDEGLVIPLNGRIRCSLPDRGSHFFAEAGYPMGNIESLAQRPRWYDAVAETPVVFVRGESTRFLDALEDHFDMAMTFLSAMAQGFLAYSRASEQRRTAEAAS